MDEDESVVLLLGDIGVYAFRDTFARHPKRCYNLGVCEQASVGLAAGLAMSGLYPIYHTISAFLVRRAYEFIRLDFGEQYLAGLFVGVGGSQEYKKLGPTHCCSEHLGLMSAVPGMRCIEPSRSTSQIDDAELLAKHFLERAVRERMLMYMNLEEPK
jgi:transketolase